jgi:hypothetical protein
MKLINRRVITQSYRKSIQSSEEHSRYKQTDNQRCGLAIRTFVQSPVDRPYKQPIIEQWTDMICRMLGPVLKPNLILLIVQTKMYIQYTDMFPFNNWRLYKGPTI